MIIIRCIRCKTGFSRKRFTAIHSFVTNVAMVHKAICSADGDSVLLSDEGEVQVRTAVLSKNNMVALLCVKTANEGGAICRVDPREVLPALSRRDRRS